MRRLILELIEDDTPMRRREGLAWRRLFDELEDSSPSQLAETSIGPATYLELYRQPELYRGRLLTVHGRAHLGYRVSAPKADSADSPSSPDDQQIFTCCG